MNNLTAIAIQPFIPAKCFSSSIKFYQALGFELVSEHSGIAVFRYQSYSFLLQDFYEPTHCENYMMHLHVSDLNAWYQHLLALELEHDFSCKLTEITTQPWGMREFCLYDPSGVLWRVAQNNDDVQQC